MARWKALSMPDPLRFEVKVPPDYFLLCPFEELDLRVQSEPWVLADELVHGLRDFGPFHQGLVTVQPATPGTLASVQVLVTRTELRAAVTFRADRLEIMTLQSQPQPDDASRLVLALLEEPWSSRPFRCSELSVTTSCHGLVEGGAAEFLSGFTGKVPDLGPFAGAGIKLRYGPLEARLRSSVDLDLSGPWRTGCTCGWTRPGIHKGFP